MKSSYRKYDVALICIFYFYGYQIFLFIESLKNMIYKLQSSKINVEKELLDNDQVKKYNIILHLRNNST